jgi:hypothetical protein
MTVLLCSAMMYVLISRNWLFSRTAQRVYLIAAILDLALLATRMGIAGAMTAAGVFTLPPVTNVVVRILLIPEVVGTAVLTVGMTYCWLGLGGSYKKKLLWIVLIQLFLVTMPVYYVAFYRPLASRERARSSALATN